MGFLVERQADCGLIPRSKLNILTWHFQTQLLKSGSIWAQVESPLPLPPLSELQGWIPSERFPSDHLSLVFDFMWQPEQGEPAAPAAAAGCGDSAGASGYTEGTLQASPDRGTGFLLASAGAAEELRDISGSNNATSGHARTDRAQQAANSGHAADPALDASDGATPASTAAPDQAAHTDRVAAAAGNEGLGGHDANARGPHPGEVLPADERGATVAAQCLARGGVVAVPTDTLYGLAACANSEEASPSSTLFKTCFLV